MELGSNWEALGSNWEAKLGSIGKQEKPLGSAENRVFGKLAQLYYAAMQQMAVFCGFGKLGSPTPFGGENGPLGAGPFTPCRSGAET